MESKVAVYESHEKALNAVHLLNEKKFPLKNLSIVGKADMINDHMHLKSAVSDNNAPMAIGAVVGTVVGLLTGVGVFAIPGFGFLYGAGAVVGAIGGFDLGLVSGGVGALLTMIGVKKESALKYESHLHEGKYLLLVKGSMDDITKAEHILHTEGTHLE